MQARGPWRQAASDMVFPPSVAGFNRTRIARFRADGSDAAAAYDLVAGDGQIAATLYVHPAPSPPTLGMTAEDVALQRDRACRDLRDRRARAMQQDHLGTAPPVTRAISVVKNGIPRQGFLIRTQYETLLAGQQQEVRSELALFCDAWPGWTIEYRFTWPASYAAEGRIAGLAGALDWPR